jgi:Nif-specific regulatory protein
VNNTHETGLDLIQRELRTMQLLFDISQALNKSLDLEELMHPVLKMISEHADMMSGTIILLNRETGEIETDFACGLSEEEQTRGAIHWAKALPAK